MKYKVGDSVIIRQGNYSDIGKSKKVTSIERMNFGGRYYSVYILDNSPKSYGYYYEGYLELDTQVMRDDKLNSILN